MQFDPLNFLSWIKQIITGGGNSGSGTTAIAKRDAGFLVDRVLNLASDLRTIDGLTLTASTVPAVLRTETNGMTVAIAASETAGGSFTFQVPRDYDEATDEFKIRVFTGLDGTTDTPTMTATVYRKRAGSALSADLAPTASAALNDSAAWRLITCSGKLLKRDDVLTINLVSGAHTTNAISIHAVDAVYRSTLVSYYETDSVTNNPNQGTSLR